MSIENRLNRKFKFIKKYNFTAKNKCQNQFCGKYYNWHKRTFCEFDKNWMLLMQNLIMMGSRFVILNDQILQLSQKYMQENC